MPRDKRIDLRGLILALALVSALITLANTLYAGYRVQHEQLLQGTLESNRVYAAKLASGTENFLRAAMQQLEYSAAILGEQSSAPWLAATEARRLKMQTTTFNTALVVDHDGTVLAVWPERPDLLGRDLNSSGNARALAMRRPMASEPYVSTTGNLMVTLSHPIVRADGSYAGYVAGGIYLHHDNILKTLLGEHFYRDGSYLYVVDQLGQLVYHHDSKRLGRKVEGNPVIEAVRRGESGARRLVNSEGTDMLAAYAPIPFVGWGVVAQRPTASTLAPMQELMRQVLGRTLPLAILLMAATWWCARRIALPLWKLARHARLGDAEAAIEQVRAVKAWYFEAENLKQAVLGSFGQMQARIGQLDQSNSTDPLTGLHNRRGLEAVLARWSAEGRGFAAVMLDIDHFKRVNDTWGHDAGDQVIRAVAQLMRDGSRTGDCLCRSGGEEFLMLLPDTGREDAVALAERVRGKVGGHAFDGMGRITISAGVAVSAPGEEPGRSLREADAALYRAKREGRDRVVAADAGARPL